MTAEGQLSGVGHGLKVLPGPTHAGQGAPGTRPPSRRAADSVAVPVSAWIFPQ